MIEGEGVPGADQARHAWRCRRVTVDLHTVVGPVPDDEMQRRERELERLIIKAACRRAARRAGEAGRAPEMSTAKARPPHRGYRRARSGER